MSATEGIDLAVEILRFLNQGWETDNFSPEPLYHNDDDGYIYPGDNETKARDIDLQNHDVVGVSYPGWTKTPVGTEFDYDVEAEVDVRCEATTFPAGGGVDGSTDFRRMVLEAQRAIDANRVFPLTNLDSRYAWRDLRIETEDNNITINNRDAGDNRDYFASEFTVTLRGWEQF
jgi:hypothetical protein